MCLIECIWEVRTQKFDVHCLPFWLSNSPILAMVVDVALLAPNVSKTKHFAFVGETSAGTNHIDRSISDSLKLFNMQRMAASVEHCTRCRRCRRQTEQCCYIVRFGAGTQMKSKKFPNEKCLFFRLRARLQVFFFFSVSWISSHSQSEACSAHRRHAISILFETNERRRDVWNYFSIQANDFVCIKCNCRSSSPMPNLAQYVKLKVSF